MDSRAYYYFLKSEARYRTSLALNRRIRSEADKKRWSGLTLCSILGHDIGNATEFVDTHWRSYYSDDTHHGFVESWEKLARRYSNAPDHFDLAIWQLIDEKQILVALALGNPSHARTHLTVKWVERYFGDNHLAGRALEPILTCAEEYAKLLGSERVLIKDPVDAGKYQRYGYAPYKHPSVAHGGSYLALELNDG